MILKLGKEVEASRLREEDDVKGLRLALLKWRYLALSFGFCFTIVAITTMILVFCGCSSQSPSTPSTTTAEVTTVTPEPQKREIPFSSVLESLNYTHTSRQDENEEGDNDLGNGIYIMRRSRWGGRPIRDGYRNRTLEHPIRLVIIGHTAGTQCTTARQCSSILQTIQTMHVQLGWVDVGYNYLIGGDGNIYEALAWNIRNYVRNNSIMISFFGNYEFDNVQDVQILALRLLLNQGIELGKLDPNYRLVAHSQVTNTLSPGTRLKEVIQQLPHYYNNTFA